jgi:membrane-associated phospholipid phosphatase
VHRRLRPEEFGGRVHLHLTGAREYPIDAEVLDSAAVKRTFEKYGTYLLPQAFPEGCPTHPAYGSGHATVAGACVTVLKAWFDESHRLPDPLVPSADGTALVPYDGPDADRLTVGGELDKLAANIGAARNMGGVHWRTDFTEAVRLGEEIAIGVLREVKSANHEDVSFTLGRFDGTSLTI